MADLTVTHDTDAHRFVATVDGEEVGHIDYRILDYPGADTVLDLYHTETSPEHGGKGYGSKLVRGALDQIKADGTLMRPTCPFVANYVEKHQEDGYNELIAPEPER